MTCIRVLFNSALAGLALSMAMPDRADGAVASDNPLDTTLFGTAEPADSVLKVDASPDGAALRIAGDLDTGSFRKVKRVLEASKTVKTVWLASGGGLVLEGFLIGSIVRQMKLDTFVDSHCASACTMILTSGARRAAYARAKIGFHNSVEIDKNGDPMPVRMEKPGETSAEEPDFMQMAAFRHAGVDSAFIDRALATPNNTIWEPSHDELLKAHVLTQSLGDPERSALTGFGPSWAEVRATLLTNPGWALIERADKAAFDDRVTDAWSSGPDDTDQHGGSVGAAERALAEWMFDRIARSDDAVIRQFLAIDALSRRPGAAQDDEDQCGALTTGAEAVARMMKDGASEPELALFKTSTSATPAPTSEPDPASAKRYARFFKVMAKAVKAEGQSTRDGIKACPWNRLAFDQIRRMPVDEQVATVRALHAYEREDD